MINLEDHIFRSERRHTAYLIKPPFYRNYSGLHSLHLGVRKDEAHEMSIQQLRFGGNPWRNVT